MIVDIPSLNTAALVDVNFVRVCRRIDTDTISRRCDDELQWVWDVSLRSKSKLRELRFWISEIVTPQMTARLTLDEVLNRILPPSRATFWAREIGQLLLLSRVSIAILARKLGAVIKNRTFQFSRIRLVEWLRERWLGARS